MDIDDTIRRHFHGFSDEQWERLRNTFPFSEIPHIAIDLICQATGWSRHHFYSEGHTRRAVPDKEFEEYADRTLGPERPPDLLVRSGINDLDGKLTPKYGGIVVAPGAPIDKPCAFGHGYLDRRGTAVEEHPNHLIVIDRATGSAALWDKENARTFDSEELLESFLEEVENFKALSATRPARTPWPDNPK